MWTWLAYLTVFICIFVIIVEYIWLYILSARSEEITTKHREAEIEIVKKIETIIYSPTRVSQESEVNDLKEYIQGDRVKMDILTEKMMCLLSETSEEKQEMHHMAFYMIYMAIDPTDYYTSVLMNGNIYDKAFACRKLSDYCAQEKIQTIRKLAFSKNKELSYNASITLSVLGDEEGVLQVILGYEKNYELSHRIIVEMLEEYSGDFETLAQMLLSQGNEYIKAAVVKALAKYKFDSFEKIYLQYLQEGSINLKIAALRALGMLAKKEYEHDLIIASNHKEWAVRSAAVKAMRKIPTENIFNAIVQSTKDSEWWVRYNAAKTLVAMDHDCIYIEKILNGYDRFATEAVKHALYQVSLREEKFKNKS